MFFAHIGALARAAMNGLVVFAALLLWHQQIRALHNSPLLRILPVLPQPALSSIADNLADSTLPALM